MVTMSTVPQDGCKNYKDDVKRLVTELNHALTDGVVPDVRAAAVELWKMQANLELAPKQADSESDWLIGLNVTLQRRGKDRCNIRLLVPRTLTIWQLKHVVSSEHLIPVNVQCWIYRRQFPKDDVTLESLDVKNGDVLESHGLNVVINLTGLYVMSEKFANEPSQPPLLDVPEPRVTAPGSPARAPAARSNSAPAAAARTASVPGAAAGRAPEPVVAVEEQQQSCSPVREPPEPDVAKWKCSQCTFMNKATRPGCEMCSADRPEDFVVPPDYKPPGSEIERMENERRMATLFNQSLKREREAHHAYIVENLERIEQSDELNYVLNTENFECPICFEEVEPGSGVKLRNCLHQFCPECLRGHVRNGEGAEVMCPYTDDVYKCDQTIQQREICAVVSKEDYEKYLGRSVRIAEGQEKNSFHCLTPNCQGWCIYEDEVNFFECPVCRRQNCLTCKVIHEGQNCKDYQYDLKRRAEVDVELKATMAGIEGMLNRGEAMKCPGCGVVLQKKIGCDWMQCSMCMTEICWATRGPRWGPKGRGDTSGGCRCRMNGGPTCTPQCQFCH